MRGWVTGAGLTVARVGAGRRYLDVRGTAAQAEATFDTGLATYRSGGVRAAVASSAPTAPAPVAADIVGVTGLGPAHPELPARVRVPDGFADARPCGTSYGEKAAAYKADGRTQLPAYKGKTRPYAVCGYTPRRLRGAYGVTKTGRTGKGATIAVIDAYACADDAQ